MTQMDMTIPRTVEDATSFTIKFNDETTGYSVDFITEEI